MPSKKRKHDGQKPLLNQYDEQPIDERPVGMPSLDQIRTEVTLQGLPPGDGDYLYDSWLVSGYRTARNVPVRNWKAAVRQWKRAGWFPSQKTKMAQLDSEAERRSQTFKRLREEQQRHGNNGA